MAQQYSSVGLVRSGTILDEVLMEMLEHQGIFYEEVSGSKGGTRYPAVLLASANNKALAIARNCCVSSDGVIVVDRTIDLSHALNCLAGLEDKREDRFDLAVNTYEVKLTALISGAFSSAELPLMRKRFWPGNAPACCVITGDVDWLTYSPFHAAVVKSRLSPGRLAGLIYGSLSGKNFGLNIDEMVNAQQKHNYRSTVFMKTKYDGGEENLAVAMSRLKDAGFEIGIHGSDGAHTSPSALSSQLDIIASMSGTRPKGIRHHILKMSIPKTWGIESSAGLDYDATFSYNKFFGFRGEICFPYHPFGAKRLGLLELPTSFMDWTALNRGLRGKSADEILKSIMKRVERYHGLLMVNFHNTYLNRQTFPDILELYEGLIDSVFQRDYWVATASECSEWWRRRAATKTDGRNLGVEGEVQVEALDF
jgi:peptidoglycan/xylan/chitin deacetylase (PgdA/CDA1 family)